MRNSVAARTSRSVCSSVSVSLPGDSWNLRAQELCESRGGRPGLPVPTSPCGLCGRKATLNEPPGSELRSCVGGRPGLPSLIVFMVSADVKQH